MKVLVATAKTQDEDASDFNRCVEGELVWVPTPCDRYRAGDHSCGCGHAFGGVASEQLTTTAKIADVPGIDLKTYRRIIRARLVSYGGHPNRANEMIEDLLGCTSEWPEGSVVCRRPGMLLLRHRRA